MSEQMEFSGAGGHLGTQLRSPGRLYCNAEQAYTNAAQLRRAFADLRENAAQYQDVSRVVLRTVVDNQTMTSIATSELGKNLEVAMPLQAIGGEGWFVYLAHNDAGRQSRLSRPALLAATEPYSHVRVQPYQPSRPHDDAVVFETALQGREAESQLFDLWHDPFGWEATDITAMAEQVHLEQGAVRHRTTWFSAARIGSVLVTAAMAERLTIPCLNGPLHLIENTEWSCDPAYRGHGLAVQTINHLNEQVRHGMERFEGPKLSYAECVMNSELPDDGSYRTSHDAGYVVPARHYADQFAIQNVAMFGRLESFVFMYLGHQAVPGSNV